MDCVLEIGMHRVMPGERQASYSAGIANPPEWRCRRQDDCGADLVKLDGISQS